ncbi:MAG: aldehyde dehydrogenase family protein, partial [Woeseia sp.]
MNLTLADPALLRDALFINGEWQRPPGLADFAVTNPANGLELARLPKAGRAEARAAIAAAEIAFPSWSKQTAKERSRLLRHWHDLI